MDLADDERIKRLNEQIQQERDREKVLQLSRELMRLLDAKQGQPRKVDSEDGNSDPRPQHRSASPPTSQYDPSDSSDT